MTPADSEAVASAGYDGRAAVLRIEYAGGAIYDYLGVPPQVYDGYQAADSKGRFVNFVIKPNYPYRRVRGRS